MRNVALVTTLSAVVVLGAGTTIVGATQQGERSSVPGREGIRTQTFSLPGGRSVDISIDDLVPGTLKLAGSSDRAAYFTAMSSDNMDCLIDDPTGEGRGCDPEKFFAERGTQTLTAIPKDGTRVGAIRSYTPIVAATLDGKNTPISGKIVPSTLEAGTSATIDLTTSDARIHTTVP